MLDVVWDDGVKQNVACSLGSFHVYVELCADKVFYAPKFKVMKEVKMC